jgi:hypothetical protein
MTFIDTTTIAYKYRSLKEKEDFDRVVGAILKNEFYCAEYRKLNDPMEGFFYSIPGTNKKLIEQINSGKKEWRVCSFSKRRDNVLLWAHYADGFKGICIKVEIEPAGGDIVVEVNYDDFPLSFSDKQAERTGAWSFMVFQEKAKPWKYERDIRLLSRNECPGSMIKVKEVYFGVRISPKHKNSLRRIIPPCIKCFDTHISEKTNKVIRK